MSLLGEKVAVVSLGMSCQSAHQIERHARLIASLCGDPTMKISRYPFDNVICPPVSASQLLDADRFHPVSIGEVEVSGDGGGHWRDMGVHYWHEMRPVRTGILRRKRLDPERAFRAMTDKYAHMASKFRQLPDVERLIFVISNSQNNLDMVARVTGNLNFVLEPAAIDRLADRADAYLGRRCEYVVATYGGRAAGRSGRHNVATYELSPDGSEWEGDPLQWAALFRQALPPKA